MTARPLAACAALTAVLASIVSGWWAPATAHQPGSTLVVVTASEASDEHGLLLTGQVPLDRIDFAYGTDLADDPQARVEAEEQWLTDLVGDRVFLSDPDGTPWITDVRSVALGTFGGQPVLEAIVSAIPPSGEVGPVDLRWDVVSDVVYSHKVFIGSAPSETTGDPGYLGVLVHHQPVIRLQVDGPVSGASSSPIRVGFDHFREGIDHLLFLSLVAPGPLDDAVGCTQRFGDWQH